MCSNDVIIIFANRATDFWNKISVLKTKGFYVFFAFLAQFVIVVVKMMKLMLGIIISGIVASIGTVFRSKTAQI